MVNESNDLWESLHNVEALIGFILITFYLANWCNCLSKTQHIFCTYVRHIVFYTKGH